MKCKTEKQNLHEISRKLKKNPHDLLPEHNFLIRKENLKIGENKKMPIQMSYINKNDKYEK